MNVKRNTKNIINQYVIKLANDVNTLSNCIVELYIFNFIQKIPIVVYNDDNIIIYIFDNGLIYHYKRDKKLPKFNNNLKNKFNYINLRFNFISHISIPDVIEVLYFK